MKDWVCHPGLEKIVEQRSTLHFWFWPFFHALGGREIPYFILKFWMNFKWSEADFGDFYRVRVMFLGFSRGRRHILNDVYAVGGTFLGFSCGRRHIFGIFLRSEAHFRDFYAVGGTIGEILRGRRHILGISQCQRHILNNVHGVGGTFFGIS